MSDMHEVYNWAECVHNTVNSSIERIAYYVEKIERMNLRGYSSETTPAIQLHTDYRNLLDLACRIDMLRLQMTSKNKDAA